MIIIHATMQVDPAKLEPFRQEIESLVAASRAEEGNVSYDLYQATDREHVYTMVEVWKGPEAVAAHNKSAHFGAFVAKAQAYLTAPLSAKAYHGELLPS